MSISVDLTISFILEALYGGWPWPVIYERFMILQSIATYKGMELA